MAGRKWHSAEDIVRKLRCADDLTAQGRVRLLFARIGGLHIHRRDQAIGDPERVVAKALQREAKRASASGAVDSGSD